MGVRLVMGGGRVGAELVTGRWGQGRVLRTVMNEETAILSRT